MNRLGQFGFSIGLPSGIATAAAETVREAVAQSPELALKSAWDNAPKGLRLKFAFDEFKMMVILGGLALAGIGFFAGKSL